MHYPGLGHVPDALSFSDTCSWVMITDILSKTALAGYLSELFVNMTSIKVDLDELDLLGRVGLDISWCKIF